MKLIIDIPDSTYESVMKYSKTANWVNADLIRNGTPIPLGYAIGLAGSFDKTLEEIRKEINDLPKTYPFINHIDTYVKTDDVISIIDRHLGDKSKDETDN